MKRIFTLCLALFALGDKPAQPARDQVQNILLSPYEILMGGAYQSCIAGLGEGMSADVRYRRPNFENVWVQFDWQQQPCEQRSMDTGWNKDVGTWEIVEIRLHPKGDYHAAWQPVSAKMNVLPNEELRPEFDQAAEVNRQAVKLIWLAGAEVLATVLAAFLLGRYFPRPPTI